MSFDLQVKGSTRIVCLFGFPVSHSLSPQIHNHAFRTLGLPYVYIPLEVPPQAIHTAAYAFRSFSFAGANITIPHKAAMARYCDTLSELSTCTGTVNTIYMSGGRLCGTTTDPEGFKRALQWAGSPVDKSNVVILGNGGTSRTLSIALALDRKLSTLTIVGRSIEKVAALASEVTNVSGIPVQALSFNDKALAEVFRRCDLLVNTTSVGMHPLTDQTPLPSKYFHKNMTVFDSIYNPLKTRFLQEAESAGCHVQNGLRMLLYQALASLRLWTGVDIPEEIFSIEELQSLIAG